MGLLCICADMRLQFPVTKPAHVFLVGQYRRLLSSYPCLISFVGLVPDVARCTEALVGRPTKWAMTPLSHEESTQRMEVYCDGPGATTSLHEFSMNDVRTTVVMGLDALSSRQIGKSCLVFGYG